MDSRQLSCLDRCDLASMDSASGFPTSACFRNLVHSARVDRLDLFSMFDSWTESVSSRAFRVLEHQRMSLGVSVAASIFLLGSTSFPALGLPVVAVHSYLAMLWCKLSTQLDELAIDQYLFLFRDGETRF